MPVRSESKCLIQLMFLAKLCDNLDTCVTCTWLFDGSRPRLPPHSVRLARSRRPRHPSRPLACSSTRCPRCRSATWVVLLEREPLARAPMQLPCSCRLASQRQRVRVAHGGTRRLTGESALTWPEQDPDVRAPTATSPQARSPGRTCSWAVAAAPMINTRLYLSAERNHLCRPLYHTTLYSIEA